MVGHSAQMLVEPMAALMASQWAARTAFLSGKLQAVGWDPMWVALWVAQ